MTDTAVIETARAAGACHRAGHGAHVYERCDVIPNRLPRGTQKPLGQDADKARPTSVTRRVARAPLHSQHEVHHVR
jgi:hypothetical protein